MHSFVRFTLRQKVVINLLFVLLIVIGAFTLFKLPVDRYPNIYFGKMYINTFLPGASPEEVETLVTREIEKGLENLEDIEYIRAGSYRQHSNIVIKFIDDSDYKKRFNDVRIKVLSIVKNLPEAAEPPEFNFLDVGDWFPAISVNVAGSHSNTTLKLVAEEVKIQLAQITGVKEVKLVGEYTREFHVLLDQEKMRRFGITFSQVTAALGQANVSIPAGHAPTDNGDFIVRVDEQFKTRDHVIETIVRIDGDGSFIRVGDLAAEAFHSYRDPLVIASVNGMECVTLQVLKNESGNALFIADAVRTLVRQLEPVYVGEGVTLSITQDSSTRIADSIRVLGVNLLVGIILVCGLIWAFMGFRNAALTTIGIPFAFLVTLIFMYLTGNSINEVSLFAFVLVSGIIVDDAIVVVENIFRHVQMGTPVTESIVIGTSEVFLPVVSATLTTVVAFLPMLLMTGMVGDFFAIIPKTIVFALAASLIECLVILPCHYLEFGPRRTVDAPRSESLCTWEESEGPLMRVTRRYFNSMILLALRFRWTTQWLLLISFVLAGWIFILSFQGKSNLIRIQFFPDNYSLFYVELIGPPGTPIHETDALVKQFAKSIAERGEGMSESALGFAGFYIDEDFVPQYGNGLGHVAVTLPPTAKRHFADYPENDVVAHLDNIRKMLQPKVPEGFTMLVRPEKDGPPTGKDINIRILGTNEANVAALAGRIEDFLSSNPDLSPWLYDLKNDQGQAGRVFRIKVNAEKVAEWNLKPSDVAVLAATVLNGQVVGEMKLPEETIDIKVKAALPNTVNLFSVLDIPIIDHPGGVVRLSDLCQPQFTLEPGTLNRFQNQRAIILTADLKAAAPYSPAMAVNITRVFYEGIRDGYPGATLSYSGEHESTQKSFMSLSYAFVIALLLIYLILTAQFSSYFQPLIIISAVLFALVGVLFGTFASRTLFTINSFVAVIGVTGVVVNDSLVLVAFINKCYRGGLKRRDALLRAANIRLRPILLTTLTTTLGLLPMALGIPEYSIIWGSMAMTFVTGLCTATFLTIILVPAQWDLVASLTDRRLEAKGGSSDT